MSRSIENLYQTLTDLIEVCHLQGIKRVVLSPGSRSAPLALAFKRSGKFDEYLIVDERSAGYFALGLAKQDQIPTVLVCTSGTAVLNYAPAVAEAYFQHVPLLVLTADRPPEWIGQNDNQAIFQNNVFGPHALGSFQMPVDFSHSDDRWSAQRILHNAIFLTLHHRRGPVHINFPFREPFYPEGNLPASAPVRSVQHHNSVNLPHPDVIRAFARKIDETQNIWVIVGMSSSPISSDLIDNFCEQTGAICLADPLSNLHLTHQSYHFDAWLSDSIEKPDMVISTGHHFLSKKLKQFLRKNKPYEHIHVQPHTGLEDPFQSISQLVTCQPDLFFEAFDGLLLKKDPSDAVKRLLFNDFKAQNELNELREPTHWEEMTVAGKLVGQLPNDCVLHLGNSSPVRYLLKWNFLLKNRGIEVYANRGTSGIDGCVSTAVGMAQKSDRTHVLLIGDLSIRYDINGLWNQYVPENFKILVINNQGGGIFRRIEGPKNQPELESYFTARQAHSFQNLAQEFGFEYSNIQRPSELQRLNVLSSHGKKWVELVFKP